MVKLSFKLFGCFTVFFFFGIVGFVMAVTALIPAAQVKPEIKESIYPLAVENTKIQFDKVTRALRSGQPKQTYILTELEANALFYDKIEKKENIPIRRSYITFYEDFVRFRFDLSLSESWYMMVNRMKGLPLQDNLKDMSRKSNPDSKNITFTIDTYLMWYEGHPYLQIKKVYIGVLPVPFRGYLNRVLLGSINDWFATKFGNASAKDSLLVRRLKLNDRMLVADLEAPVTKNYVETVERTQAQKKNPALSSMLGMNQRFCRYCSDADKQEITDYVQSMAKQDKISEEDIQKAQEMIEDDKAREAPPAKQPNQQTIQPNQPLMPQNQQMNQPNQYPNQPYRLKR